MNPLQHPEYWQRGPIEGIDPFLQPAAHAILQAREETVSALVDFPEPLLWIRPGGMASVAFHVQHMKGVLDRLFTYALGRQLSSEQLAALQQEGKEDPAIQLAGILQQFNAQVEIAISQLKATDGESLLEPRAIGRKQIPSNVLGLLFHTAEHLQRHTGQLIVTVKILLTEHEISK